MVAHHRDSDNLFETEPIETVLDRRSRRWITLSCVCATGVDAAMRAYIGAALNSGDISANELREFVLQFAVFQGFPRGAQVELILNEILAARASV